MPDDRPATLEPDPLPERRFGESDMFVAHDEDPRDFSPVTGERATLLDYLHAYRQTLELKCRDLDAEQMARRSVPPSNLSLLGLVRHMADVERFWFRQVLAGEDVSPVFRTGEDRDGAFDGAVGEPAAVEEAWSAWRSEVAFAEHLVENAPSLDVTVRLRTPSDDEDVELRQVLVHMIEEYARHCGHADLIRERIDGRVGT